MKQFLVLGMAVALAGAALAYPSLLGPTGGANLPVARTAEQGKIIVALNYLADGSDYYYYEPVTTGIGYEESDDVSNTLNVALLYGVTPNLEVGATYNNQDEDWMARIFDEETGETIVMDGEELGMSGSIDRSNWGLNAKYVFADVFPGTNIGFGGLYQFYNQNDQNLYQLYAVATKLFTEGGDNVPVIRGTLGVNYTAFKRTVLRENADGDLVDVDIKNNATRPFVNFDFVFANKMNVAVEYQFLTNHSFEDKGLSSIVLRYPFTDNLTGQIGMSNSFRGVAGGEGHNLLAGVSYAFGGASE